MKEESLIYGGRNCGKTAKIIGVFYVSKYMVKKYGYEEALIRKLKIKTK